MELGTFIKAKVRNIGRSLCDKRAAIFDLLPQGLLKHSMEGHDSQELRGMLRIMRSTYYLLGNTRLRAAT